MYRAMLEQTEPVVKALHGEISVHSKANAGTVFTLRFLLIGEASAVKS